MAAYGLLRLQQRLANTSVQTHLLVDRLSRLLKLLLMLVLCRVEEPADNAIMQVDDLIGHSGHPFDGHRHKSGIAPLWLEPGQIGRCHLATLAGDLE